MDRWITGDGISTCRERNRREDREDRVVTAGGGIPGKGHLEWGMTAQGQDTAYMRVEIGSSQIGQNNKINQNRITRKPWMAAKWRFCWVERGMME